MEKNVIDTFGKFIWKMMNKKLWNVVWGLILIAIITSLACCDKKNNLQKIEGTITSVTIGKKFITIQSENEKNSNVTTVNVITIPKDSIEKHKIACLELLSDNDTGYDSISYVKVGSIIKCVKIFHYKNGWSEQNHKDFIERPTEVNFNFKYNFANEIVFESGRVRADSNTMMAALANRNLIFDVRYNKKTEEYEIAKVINDNK
ncbi:MAG: hypothetical protein MUF50_04275 [Planctomycetes bacterium]|jgi:hypothetical protein|nr:hypothetical protein [Planctomycetota bacterium]